MFLAIKRLGCILVEMFHLVIQHRPSTNAFFRVVVDKHCKITCKTIQCKCDSVTKMLHIEVLFQTTDHLWTKTLNEGPDQNCVSVLTSQHRLLNEGLVADVAGLCLCLLTAVGNT